MSADPFNGGSSATMFMSTGRDPAVEQIRLEVVRQRALVNTAGIGVRLKAGRRDTREVLESLGLIEPLSVSKSSGRHRGQLGGSNPSTADSGGKQAGSRGRSTDDKGRWTPKTRENPELCPKQLHPWIPDNQICRNDRGGVSCRLCYNATTRARKAGKRPEQPASPESEVVESPKLEPGQRLCGKKKHVLPPGENECVPCRYHRVNGSRRKKTLAKAKALIAAEPTVEVAEFDTDGTPLLRCKRKWHHKPDSGPCLPCKQISRAKQTVRESEEAKT